MLRFFLDNTQVNNDPIGAENITERNYFSEDLYCTLIEVNGNLIFWGEEYEYLLDLWLENNCATVDLVIEKFNVETNVWDAEFKGFIFLSDVIFDDDRQYVECEIVDNSFIAMIDNNRSIQMNLNVPLSKNIVDISSYYSSNPAGSIFTHVGGGTYNGRTTISVYDSFAALIAFMTDGECEFDSVFFSDPTTTYTEGNQYYIVTGAAIFDAANTTLPTISFDELFTDMRRSYNLRIGVETAASGKPLIRIEPKDYFRNTNSYTLNEFIDIKFKRKAGNEFTEIQVGNELSDEANTLPIFDYIWDTYKTRNYFLSGQCNKKENVLNLKMETLCADVRVINSVGTGAITQDDKIFIYAEPLWNAGADEFWEPWFLYGVGLLYNNKSLTNGRIIDRWQDDIFSNVTLLEYFVNDMRASVNAPQVITGNDNVIFGNDSTGGNYDNGNTYDNTTGLYTCLITGTYRVRFSLTLSSAGGTSNFNLAFAAGIGGGSQTQFWYFGDSELPVAQTLTAGQTETYELEYEVPLLVGTDIGGGTLDAILNVIVNKTGGAGTLTISAGYFEVFTPASGVFRNFTANGQYSKEITASGHIDSNTWANIKTNNDYLLEVQGVNGLYKGYIMDVERNISSGKTTLKILGKP